MNLFIARHGEANPTYFGEDCDITSDGHLQMANLGLVIGPKCKSGFSLLESPTKRTQQSSTALLDSLSMQEILCHDRLTLNSLLDPGSEIELIKLFSSYDSDLLVMTHTPVIDTLVPKMLDSKKPMDQLPQGYCMHLKRLPNSHSEDVAQFQFLDMIGR